MANDRLIAIDGYEIQDQAFVKDRLHEKNTDDNVTFHLFRYGELIEKEVTLTQPPDDQITLRPRKEASLHQRKLLEDWLHTTWTAMNA
jgi:predicted metalloprotease with PDZ domain